MPSEPLVAVYGRTYWDAEVELELSSLASGKGKVDAHVTGRCGGFAGNAARSLGPMFPSNAVRVVTVVSAHEEPRVRAALPEGVALDAVVTEGLGPLPINVILNPARECRILH